MPIMAVGAHAGGRALMLGLSHRDIAQLLRGEAIKGSLERCLNIPGLRMFIFAGETDEFMKQALGSAIPTTTLPREATAEDLDKMLEEDAKKIEAAPSYPLTHILKYGEALCRFTVQTPSEWPPGHRWVRTLDELLDKELILNPCKGCSEKASGERAAE